MDSDPAASSGHGDSTKGVPVWDNVYVVYARGKRSGGNLALVQLVAKINAVGGRAWLSATPGTEDNPEVAEYRAFGAPEQPIVDEAGNLVIFSAYSFRDIRTVKKATVAVWWLSVEKAGPFRLARKYQSLRLIDRLRFLLRKDTLKEWFSFAATLRNRRVSIHFSQSDYARSVLKDSFRLNAVMLGDYLYPPPPKAPKARSKTTAKPLIVFNPLKGSGPKVRQIRNRFPGWEWSAVENLSHGETQELLQRATVFLDLGIFPGKDRLPREARALGVPVVLAKRGSVASDVDVPLAEKFKIDLTPGWQDRVVSLVNAIGSNREKALVDQKDFLDSIALEEDAFTRQVREIFLRHN